MKKTFHLLWLLLPATLLSSACNKAKEEKQPLLLLTQKAWIPTFIGQDTNGDGKLAEDNSAENAMAVCQTGNQWAFELSGVFMIRIDKSTSCITSNGGPFPWSLAKNGVDLNVSGMPATVDVLDENTLQFHTMAGQEKSYYVFKH